MTTCPFTGVMRQLGSLIVGDMVGTAVVGEVVGIAVVGSLVGSGVGDLDGNQVSSAEQLISVLPAA